MSLFLEPLGLYKPWTLLTLHSTHMECSSSIVFTYVQTPIVGNNCHLSQAIFGPLFKTLSVSCKLHELNVLQEQNNGNRCTYIKGGLCVHKA